jgi:hypothetical protein
MRIYFEPSSTLRSDSEGGPSARISRGLRPTKEVSLVGDYPAYTPHGFKLGVSRRMVLHQEPGGGAIPSIHKGVSSEAEQLDMGTPNLGEGACGVSREGAVEAHHGGGAQQGAPI